MNREFAHTDAQPKPQENGSVQLQDGIADERKRLARLIGRLLARHWLREHGLASAPQPPDHPRSDCEVVAN